MSHTSELECSAKALLLGFRENALQSLPLIHNSQKREERQCNLLTRHHENCARPVGRGGHSTEKAMTDYDTQLRFHPQPDIQLPALLGTIYAEAFRC